MWNYCIDGREWKLLSTPNNVVYNKYLIKFESGYILNRTQFQLNDLLNYSRVVNKINSFVS